MPARVEWPGLPKLVKQLHAIKDVDCTPLGESCAALLIEGNRRGILAGVDGFDQPMQPLKYRGGQGVKTKYRQKPAHGTNRFASAGGEGGNLTTAEYRQLTGPRLAARGDASRVIKNLHFAIEHLGPGHWEVVCAWHDVVSTKGVDFLKYHFAENRGKARFPRYDLRPIRPNDFRLCMNATRAFAKEVFFEGI